MEVTFYGTRGSVPIAGPGSAHYGGNTTCLRFNSPSLPARHWLAIDAGTGIVPLAGDALKNGIQVVTVLSTHYHHDHTQGALLCPLTFIKGFRINWYGPSEDGVGPREMLEAMMRPPYFPVSFAEVASHFACRGMVHPSEMAILVHPEGGFRLLKVDELEMAEQRDPTQVRIGDGRYDLQTCLVIKMYKANHPERTVSYRVEERATGKVFVFATDHENLDGMPQALLRHFAGADLLVMDAQYPRELYDRMTAGFGHGTPDYCARVAAAVGAKRLGLTHHNPQSTDAVVDEVCAAARDYLTSAGSDIDVFACADYQVVEV